MPQPATDFLNRMYNHDLRGARFHPTDVIVSAGLYHAYVEESDAAHRFLRIENGQFHYMFRGMRISAGSDSEAWEILEWRVANQAQARRIWFEEPEFIQQVDAEFIEAPQESEVLDVDFS